MLLVPRLSGAQATNNINENTKNKEDKMSVSKSNKEVIQKLYEQCLNKRNMGLLRDLISGDYAGIRGVKGVAGFEEPIVVLIKAFPDIQWKVEEIVGEDDKVVARWKWEGSHTGQFQEYAATGKTITNDGMAIYEFRDGKIVNVQIQTDRLGFLQQLEVVPANPATLLPGKKAEKEHVRFIDKFIVPAKAKQEFVERMNINRNFIKKLPGFAGDEVYERTDEQGNFICITIAVWENEDALKKAKDAVQAEYKRQGFDPAKMLERLNITMDRGTYKEAGN
jgi:steroid delta-isomerase-like uncharacterized protein